MSFRLAVQHGHYYGASPIRETSIPAARRSDETYAYFLTEELSMIQAVPEPAATMLAVAAFTVARRGEIRGVSGENYRNGGLLIDCSIWNEIATEPKSIKSRAPIPVIGWLAAKLAAHRQRIGSPTSGPIFPHHAGKVLDPNNLSVRVILLRSMCVEPVASGNWNTLEPTMNTNAIRGFPCGVGGTPLGEDLPQSSPDGSGRSDHPSHHATQT